MQRLFMQLQNLQLNAIMRHIYINLYIVFYIYTYIYYVYIEREFLFGFRLYTFSTTVTYEMLHPAAAHFIKGNWAWIDFAQKPTHSQKHSHIHACTQCVLPWPNVYHLAGIYLRPNTQRGGNFLLAAWSVRAIKTKGPTTPWQLRCFDSI